MAEDYPYMVSNNKIKPILDAIMQAAKPSKFSHDFLKKLGFNSSNDRAFISLFRRLGFINYSGAPTDFYDDLKDKNRLDHALGERVRDLYSELYTLNTAIHSASDDDIKGAIARVTGKDSKSVSRYFATFKTLTGIAKFDGIAKIKPVEDASSITKKDEKLPEIPAVPHLKNSQFHYNIQIHLPATTDVSVYNAIFKSLKDTLLA